MSENLVSVIIVNWNGAKLLEVCLPSLKSQTYHNFEVIVVDNGSVDNSIEFLEKNYSDFVKIIKNDDNLGFAKGNNIGIKAASGEFIITLNNDIQADRYLIEELTKPARSDEKIGMCAPKIYSFYNRDIIDSVGVNIYWDGMSRGRARLEKDVGQYDNQRNILIPSACTALYRKKMLDEIGLFDEDFFAYCEDTDLGLRGRLAGWECILVPTAKAYHLYSSTGGKYSSFKAFMVERNHVWVALKIFPLQILFFSPIFTLFRLITQCFSVLRYSRVNGYKLSKLGIYLAVFKAYFCVLKTLPSTFKKRKIIFAKKKISNAEIYSWFKKFCLSAKDFVLD